MDAPTTIVTTPSTLLEELVERTRLRKLTTELVSYIIPFVSVCQIVIDTNVFISALRSRRGASHHLLLLVGSEQFELNISVPLILEYEDVANRQLDELSLSESEIDDVLDYVCAVANHRTAFYLWRPFLKDPRDDMVLELAVTANCEFIITFNKRDFQGVERFGIRLLTPKEFLQEIGAVP